jgi:hypothetical protein
MDWVQFLEALDITFSFSALLDFAAAEFEGILTMPYHTATTTRGVEFGPNRLPNEL